MTQSNGITLEERYRLLRKELVPLVGSGEATAMTRLIFHALKGWSATDIVIHAADTLSPYLLERIDEIEGRLKKGEPLQYILGEGRFYGMMLEVTPATLIPRPETEELVEIIAKDYDGVADLRVLDVGTGSGAIAIALSRNLKFPCLTAVDISEAALEVARRNAARLHAKIDFLHADIFQWEPERRSLDLIVSNPPYICEKEKVEMDNNVVEYEPAEALFVPDSNPLLFYSRIAEIGKTALVKGGRLYFEINPLHAEELVEMMEEAGYKDVRILRDLSGKERFMRATL